MRFRRLQIRIQTAAGPHGITLDFPDGLVVVWADNSMGKSTCVKAILVALGMEAMLETGQSELPLPPAMKSRLSTDTGEAAVLESEIFLEIENSAGSRVVVQRTVKGERSKNLVTVHEGPALSYPNSTYPSRDYFVSRAGAATRETGFHHFLTRFFGWTLPAVQTYDGNEVPLYLQCLFPFIAVEQTRGWSTVLPPIPSQFRIRDAHKRAIEFLLNMDAHRVALDRQSLQFRKAQIETLWAAQMLRAHELAKRVGGAIQGLPPNPVSIWPPRVQPSLMVPVGESWVTVADRANENSRRLRQLVEQDIPRVTEVAGAVQAELASTEQEVQQRQTLISRLLETLENEEQESQRVSERITAVDEDIQRNKDARTLRGLGSRQGSTVDQGSCPVCHQEIADSLVPLPAAQAVMTLDDNIQFLTEQRRAFGAVLANSERITGARRQQVRALRDELNALRERVRALRQTLVSDGRLPSLAAIQSRVALEAAINRDLEAAGQVETVIGAFQDLADSWRDVLADLADLPREDTTDADRQKLSKWNSLFKEQLAYYGFASFDATEAMISPDTYRPEHEGFDLQTSISASDLIRTIWSYLSGLLEVSRTHPTNHPGSIIFDEPRQQSTRDVSFAALLKRAAAAGQFGQQVIFFTSEDKSRLQSHLVELPHTFNSIDGRVLKAHSGADQTESAGSASA